VPVLLDKEPAIAANEWLEPQRYPEWDMQDLKAELARKVIDRNDLVPTDIDGVVTNAEGDDFDHEVLYDHLGLEPTFSTGVVAGGAAYGVMLRLAMNAIATGQCESVLVLGGGKFPDVDDGGQDMAELVSHPEFEYPYGPFIPAMYALPAARWMEEYDVTVEDLSHVSVSSREWALQTPAAKTHDEGPLTVEDIVESAKVVWPFHRYHCSIPTEGGEAFVVTSGDRARELTDSPAYVLGIGEKNTHGFMSQSPSFTETGAKQSGEQAFEMAELGPDDVDVAEIYDAFASNPPMILEDLGFAESGEGTALFEAGRTAPGGDLPVNTHGGLLSFGHAAGASPHNEAMNQVRGTAGDRQIEDAEVVLCHTYGGMQCQHVTAIFGRNPP
jgi:acetyl-CoA acetyltransferase